MLPATDSAVLLANTCLILAKRQDYFSGLFFRERLHLPEVISDSIQVVSSGHYGLIKVIATTV